MLPPIRCHYFLLLIFMMLIRFLLADFFFLFSCAMLLSPYALLLLYIVADDFALLIADIFQHSTFAAISSPFMLRAFHATMLRANRRHDACRCCRLLPPIR